MKRTDAVISFIIGLLIGIFAFLILGVIGFDFPYRWLLIIFFPPASLAGMWVASWLGKRFIFILQASRFALVGALNTFIDLGILNLLIFLSGAASGFLFMVFKGISFLVAVINSYYWNKYWTFGGANNKSGTGEFYKFLVIVSIGLGINVGIASSVVNIIGPQFGEEILRPALQTARQGEYCFISMIYDLARSGRTRQHAPSPGKNFPVPS